MINVIVFNGYIEICVITRMKFDKFVLHNQNGSKLFIM